MRVYKKSPAAAYQSKALSFRRVKVVFILLQPLDRPLVFCSTVLIERPKEWTYQRKASLIIHRGTCSKASKKSRTRYKRTSMPVWIKAFSLSAREI